MEEVYINGVGKFLPGPPVDNEHIEDYIKAIHGKKSRMKGPTLRQNGIVTRHYALNEKGEHCHSNASMAGKAGLDALAHSEIGAEKIEYLASATSIGDLIIPGIASSVHASLKFAPLEIASFQSVCASGIMALKSAYMQVKAGEKKAALVTGSEFASRWFQPGFYESVTPVESAEKPELSTEFLRWTLSDGAGAVVVENQPNERKRSLKIEWIELRSYADRFEPCMYAGVTTNGPEGKTWGSFKHPGEAYENGALMIAQDFKLLYTLFPVWVGYYLELLEKHNLKPEEVHHFLPHYSAESLGSEMKKLLTTAGAMVPEERWFTNLRTCGNTGTAAIYVILEELVNQRELKSGEKILCFIPESGQCAAAFMLLTVV
jgi:3-oxoacyl-[acyl-carrier-protein] synthase-3